MAGQPLHGILWMLASTLWMAGMHGAVRHVSSRIHPFEIAFMASLFGLLVVVPSFARSGLTPLRTERLGLHAVRAVLHVIAMFVFFFALAMAPLALVTALAFTAPIYATVLAVPLFGERIEWRRWVAILVGFAGMLVVLRPGILDIEPGALMALGASVVFSGVLVATKALSRTETGITITAYMLLLMVPMTLVPALFVWRWPDPTTLGWLVFIGVASAFGRLFLAEALRAAPTHVIMPIDFFRLIWVTGIGYVAFDDVPDLFTWVGGALILAGTGAIAYSEDRGARKP